MRGARAWVGLLSIGALLCSSSCATPAVVPVASPGSPLARPGAPWPSSVAACVLKTDWSMASCSPGFDVLASASGRVVARVDRRDMASVEWSSLPVLGAPRVARVVASAEGMIVRGWAPFDRETFELRSNIPIVRGHVWVPSGAELEVLGTSGADIVARVPTPFAEPQVLEVSADCGSFGASAGSARVPAGPPFARARGSRIDLRAAPDGPVVFSFAPRGDAAFVLFGRTASSAHIAGGPAPWVQVLGDERIVFDGWVDRAALRVMDTVDEGPDRDDGGCAILDSIDSCGSTRITVPTPLRVGVDGGGEIIGELSGRVKTFERAGDFVAITTTNSAIVPPQGARFWVLAASIANECIPALNDGCPCEEPN